MVGIYKGKTKHNKIHCLAKAILVSNFPMLFVHLLDSELDILDKKEQQFNTDYVYKKIYLIILFKQNVSLFFIFIF
jgi:hypothetical protein